MEHLSCYVSWQNQNGTPVMTKVSFILQRLIQNKRFAKIKYLKHPNWFE